MTQSSQDPSAWTAWITAAVAISGLIYTAAKRFFSFVTRAEFEKTIDAKHKENKESQQETKEALARIEGKLDAGQLGVIASRLSRNEQDVQELRQWKHSVDPYIERKLQL